MTLFEAERLDDIVQAIAAVQAHLLRGPVSDALVGDAVRMRLVEIGEAVKALSDEAKASEPHIPWMNIARMRDLLTHRYFMTDLTIVERTVEHELGPLLRAVQRLLDRSDRGPETGPGRPL